MSWGNRLLLVFVAFAALIGTLVYKAMNTRFELVTKDYYKEELRYQQKIDGARNAAVLSPVALQQNQDFVTVVMPAELKNKSVTGELLFYCGSDADRDLQVPLQLNAEGEQLVSKRKLRQGNYLVKLRWQESGNSYYTEKQLQVN